MTGTFDNQIVFSPLTEGGEATDGIKLSLDEDNKYLYFINRETNTLWQYDLKPELEPQTP
jgi:sugar lactone lactonase YvrE